MSLSDSEVRKVAALSQLAFAEHELQQLGGELSAIVSFVEQLAHVNVDGVEPVAQVTGLVNVTRSDTPGTMLTSEEALAGAPRCNQQAFLVPKAVDRS